MTGIAAITDLRSLFAGVGPRFGQPAEDAELEQDEQTPADDDSSSTPADDLELEEDSAGEDVDDEEAIKNPRIKALSDENKKHRHVAKQERDRADAEKERADGLQERVSTLMLENAFIKASAGRIRDYDAALKLMDRTGITITNEGEVTGVEEAVTKVIDRYPYLADEDAPTDTALNAALTALEPSGRPLNGKRASITANNNKVLRDKFPALRHRR